MSTKIDTFINGMYNIEATRFCGKTGLSLSLTIGDGEKWMCIAMPKREAIEFCLKIICSLNELGN